MIKLFKKHTHACMFVTGWLATGLYYGINAGIANGISAGVIKFISNTIGLGFAIVIYVVIYKFLSRRKS